MPCVSSSAASDVSLARLGSRIIRAIQSSPARVETAESVAKEQPDLRRLEQECDSADAALGRSLLGPSESRAVSDPAWALRRHR